MHGQHRSANAFGHEQTAAGHVVKPRQEAVTVHGPEGCPARIGDLAADLTYHFHGDHLLSLLLNISAGQLNTLVNFESALLGLDGQFSVGGNTLNKCLPFDGTAPPHAYSAGGLIRKGPPISRSAARCSTDLMTSANTRKRTSFRPRQKPDFTAGRCGQIQAIP